ncbi:MAG: hypothetical protein FLDDKLPJ_02889 [Phycisphaerae bacterium]|nr:hypothetical protein [Phycisphaerae bacterium]
MHLRGGVVGVVAKQLHLHQQFYTLDFKSALIDDYRVNT